ncbi:MAG: hypothetical protein DHS20C09_13620 [marine bacterium B5-7]|nr:MAG: hypothetical protein DHS20C09_13620 [marine bacterium B5-7]
MESDNGTNSSMTYAQTGSAKLTNFVIILVICVILVAAAMLLPKGFSEDLSIIGKGSVVVVLTHDKNSVNGMEMMDLLNKVRSDYKGKVDFLAVDVNSPKGQAFIQQQRVGTIVLVLFGPDGSRGDVIGGDIGEQELRSALDNIL